MQEDVNIQMHHLICLVVLVVENSRKPLFTCNVLVESKRGNLLQIF